ncbi:DUF6503 family protein [Spongiivirga citrea]|uniref:Threonine synthase n=1 Tax=Spongiivirga citrea TaxID=1481457 RepID=A0A6M0CGG4_9FLAO|nr:DUF6503 family protein [Spongiivirga citrea]NER15993.1 hypothetical protein [Spongiivirga citrea]
MKNTILVAALLLMFTACKQEQKESSTVETAVAEKVKPSKVYPADVAAIFNAHGGLETWKKMNSMSFEIVKEDGNEKQTIDLKSRNDLIETPSHTIGFDGTKSWLLEKEAGTYKGNARFYHNLMFYFYAMPFVLADDGINFEKADPITFEEKIYPGIKVSYNAHIGDSPNDNYFLYYDEATKQMQWLGYTVTFGKDDTSTNVKYIRYSDWGDHGGLILPNSMTWHKVEEGAIKEAVSTRTFANINVSKETVDAKIFEVPEGAVVPEQ